MKGTEFYEEMSKPESPDSMVFEITSSDPDPEHTFSIEAIEGMVEQFKMFLLARIYARKDTPVKKARVFTTFMVPSDDAIEPQSLGLPWWAAQTDNGTTVADGESRVRGLDNIEIDKLG